MLEREKQVLEYEETLRRLREQSQVADLIGPEEMGKLEEKLNDLKLKVYSKLSANERITICRHAKRPKAVDYIERLVTDFTELHGDRTFSDDPSIVGGIGCIGEHKLVVVGQEKGSDTENRLHRNFGMCHPEGFRKARRLMQLAAKFQLPVVSIVDTPGAYCGLSAEERGQGWVIAENLREMAMLPTPIVVVIIGEASSGGALAIAVGDRIGMMEHGYYSVISPEGCASILWKDAANKDKAASALKLNAENMLEYAVIDEIIPEPLGGAHHNPGVAVQAVGDFIQRSLQELKETASTDQLLQKRYERFRKLGKFQ